jgi:RND family efflux transporter MFP subunit
MQNLPVHFWLRTMTISLETQAGKVEQSGRKGFGIKSIVSIVLCVILLSMGYAGMTFMASLAPKPAFKDPPLPSLYVDAYEVNKTNLQELTSAFGTARSDRDIAMTAYVSGEIVETFNLEVGETIQASDVSEVSATGPSGTKPGDVVIRIDKRDYEQKRTMTEDRIKESETELKRLAQEEKNLGRKLAVSQEDFKTFQAEYNRQKGLYDKQVITQNALSNSLLELRRYEDSVIQLETEIALLPAKKELAERKLVTLQGELKQTETDLSRTSISPPFTGIISEVYVEKGQYVRSGDQLFRMVDKNNVLVKIPISQSAYEHIQQSNKKDDALRVLLGPSEKNSEVWFGYVVRFSPMADERTRTVDVYIEVDNTQQKTPLLPGMFVMVKILGQVHEKIMAVPRDAIMQNAVYVLQSINKDAEGKKAGESKVEKYQVKTVPVKTLDSFQTISLIEGDIIPGDKIVTTNLDKITELIEENGKFTLTLNKIKSLQDEAKSMKIPLWRVLE